MPGMGGRFGTKLPPPAAMTSTGAVSTVPDVRGEPPFAVGGLVEARGHFAEMEDGLERRNLLHQPVGQLLAGADGQAWDVVDRFLGVELGALAARPVENIDQVRLELGEPKLEHGEQAHRARANNDDIGGCLAGPHRKNRPFLCFRCLDHTGKWFFQKGVQGEKAAKFFRLLMNRRNFFQKRNTPYRQCA